MKKIGRTVVALTLIMDVHDATKLLIAKNECDRFGLQYVVSRTNRTTSYNSISVPCRVGLKRKKKY